MAAKTLNHKTYIPKLAMAEKIIFTLENYRFAWKSATHLKVDSEGAVFEYMDSADGPGVVGYFNGILDAREMKHFGHTFTRKEIEAR